MSDPVDPRIEEAKGRYWKACHAMQTGVAVMMERDGSCEPKHLRTGINSAMVEHSVLVTLLIEKGIIDQAEWMERLAAGMEAEVALYEKQIFEALGRHVKLL